MANSNIPADNGSTPCQKLSSQVIRASLVRSSYTHLTRHPALALALMRGPWPRKRQLSIGPQQVSSKRMQGSHLYLHRL
jgi:hypothetical protein